MLITLPHRYSLFSVNKEDEMLASAITINVTDKIAYVLFWGDAIKFRDFSPTVYLANSLITHYRNLEYNFLDLSVCVNGTRGEDDIGLLTFKRNLGATSSKKLTLYRSK
jgi:lipid II:glycine glycyltransferase (peptidoglycan interpeptide bridge formation enzyme)